MDFPGATPNGSFQNQPLAPAPATTSPATISPATYSPATYSPATISPATYSPATTSPATYSPATISPATYSPATYSRSPATISPSPATISPSPAIISPSPATVSQATISPVLRRRRGIASVLEDILNQIPITRPRESKRQAQEHLKITVKRPRGDNISGSEIRWAKVIPDTPGHSHRQPVKQPVIQPVSTLQKLLKQCPDVFEQGSRSIEDYVERNISPELHTSMSSNAINIYGSSVCIYSYPLMSHTHG